MAFVFRSPPSCQVKTGACKHLKINTTIYQVQPRGPRLHFIFLLCIRFSLKYTLENKASFEAEHSSGEHNVKLTHTQFWAGSWRATLPGFTVRTSQGWLGISVAGRMEKPDIYSGVSFPNRKPPQHSSSWSQIDSSGSPGLATLSLCDFGQIILLKFHFLICKMRIIISASHNSMKIN